MTPTDTQTPELHQIIQRLKELKPYHINPYNLGDEREISNLLDKLFALEAQASTHSASFSASESKESILRKKFHGFSDEQWEEIKNTFPYNEMPFAMETYAAQSSASFSLEVVEDAFNEGVDDHLRGDSAYKTGKNYIKERLK